MFKFRWKLPTCRVDDTLTRGIMLLLLWVTIVRMMRRSWTRYRGLPSRTNRINWDSRFLFNPGYDCGWRLPSVCDSSVAGRLRDSRLRAGGEWYDVQPRRWRLTGTRTICVTARLVSHWVYKETKWQTSVFFNIGNVCPWLLYLYTINIAQTLLWRQYLYQT